MKQFFYLHELINFNYHSIFKMFIKFNLIIFENVKIFIIIKWQMIYKLFIFLKHLHLLYKFVMQNKLFFMLIK